MIIKSFIAIGAGLISFLSPCVLPIIPGYISYITGKKLNEIEKIIKDPFFYYADEKNKPALMKKYGQANNTVTKLKVIEEYIIGLKEEEEEDEDFEYLDNLINVNRKNL